MEIKSQFEAKVSPQWQIGRWQGNRRRDRLKQPCLNCVHDKYNNADENMRVEENKKEIIGTQSTSVHYRKVINPFRQLASETLKSP